MSQALAVSQVQTAIFDNRQIETWQVDGRVYFSPRAVCKNMGLNWKTQYRKLVSDELYEGYSTVVMRTTVEGGRDVSREIFGLDTEAGYLWLARINANRVKPERKGLVLKYQRECMKALRDYWEQGVAINPRTPNTDHDDILEQFLPHLQVEHQKSNSKDINGKLFREGGKDLTAKYNREITEALSDLGIRPSEYKERAKRAGWPAKNRGAGLDVLRIREPHSAAAISLYKALVLRGVPENHAMSIAKSFKETTRRLNLAEQELSKRLN